MEMRRYPAIAGYRPKCPECRDFAGYANGADGQRNAGLRAEEGAGSMIPWAKRSAAGETVAIHRLGQIRRPRRRSRIAPDARTARGAETALGLHRAFGGPEYLVQRRCVPDPGRRSGRDQGASRGQGCDRFECIRDERRIPPSASARCARATTSPVSFFRSTS